MKYYAGLLIVFWMLSCSDDDADDGSANGDNTSNQDNNGGANGDGNNDSSSFGGDITISGDDTDDICESVSSGASVDTVFLAFAFDVSGSMGKGDYPWHDVTLKWDPVKAATDAFFQDPASSDLWASMTFFPAEDDRCEDASYLEPDVPFTALPSTAFGLAMDAIRQDDWRGGTPTKHVMSGVLEFVRETRDTTPGKYVIVLVTDGFPQGCDDNEIESVVAIAADGAADGVLTFVIGVNNPPLDGAPDTVSNLGDIAVGGGTGGAFIINTGDPDQTASDFVSVVNNIRSETFVCTVSIPEPPDGRTFDKKRVRVTYTSGGNVTELSYDPACAGNLSWYYDNVDNPTKIVLCDNTCNVIQNDPNALFEVEFACTDTIPVV